MKKIFGGKAVIDLLRSIIGMMGRWQTVVGGEESHERTHLQKPVKLQPSWEGNDLSEAELNFNNLTMDNASLQIHTPRDKYSFVYIIFLIHGIATLLPWNMFINAISNHVEHSNKHHDLYNNHSLGYGRYQHVALFVLLYHYDYCGFFKQ
ncbi:hypothetical protein D910_00831 [Dendroctonus ponderosae]|uniref:Uncharacterized protein n=1 Tax=Dendroctonus ponderosae TaxID=77166 RepID=U4USD4_DENPD|nr:hypothetical protein D910_00831 [Dendroctonus ponderosae]